VFRHANFSEVAEVARAEGFQSVDAIVADLGVSSMMLDQPGRGFSFQSDGPLDMRMDQEQSTTAADIVNHTRERELADLIFKFGEERRSRPIARAIVGKRPLHTTAALARVVESVSGPRRHGRIHPATRTFMALRLVVNRELENLEKFLDTAPGLLADGGRLAVISFHSLEDRIVKHRMRALGHVLTKKVVRAGDDERRSNPRSQSAKLRVMEKK
jgi:16S rRNA (cytosine1402-N4)-methyltransferase